MSLRILVLLVLVMAPLDALASSCTCGGKSCPVKDCLSTPHSAGECEQACHDQGKGCQADRYFRDKPCGTTRAATKPAGRKP